MTDLEKKRAYNRSYKRDRAKEFAEKQRIWRMNNPGKNSEYCRRYREKHPDRIAAIHHSNYQKNREKRLEYARHRRIAKEGSIRRYAREYARSGRENLSDVYVKNTISNATGIPMARIKDRELLGMYRNLILLKRSIRRRKPNG